MCFRKSSTGHPTNGWMVYSNRAQANKRKQYQKEKKQAKELSGDVKRGRLSHAEMTALFSEKGWDFSPSPAGCRM